MKTAVIYLRVSTDKQAEKGLSIPAQREAMLSYAKSHEYEVLQEFVDEGESARSADRPQLQEMLAFCKKEKVQALIVHKVDRLARNVHDHATIRFLLKQSGTRLFSVTENIDESPEGEVLEGIMAVLAQYYSRNLGREVLKGMSRRAQDGLWNTKAPLGYRNVSEALEGKMIRKWVEPDPKTSAVVRRAFEMFATGRYSAAAIGGFMAGEGVSSVRGKAIAPSVVCRMLKKKFYAGYVYWRGIEAQGQHEALINLETYHRVQNILSGHLHGRTRKRKHFFILRGTAFCGECGARVTGEKHTTSSGRLIEYYRCAKRKNNRPVACNQAYASKEDLESQLQRLFKNIRVSESLVVKIRKNLREIYERENADAEHSRKALRGQIEALELREKSLVEKYLDGKIDEVVYRSIKDDISRNRSELQARAEKNEGSLAGAVRVFEQALDIATDARGYYDRATDDLKTALVRVFFARLTVIDGRITKAELNPPLDRICQLAKKNTPVVFDGGTLGSPNGNRTRIPTLKAWCPSH